MATDCPRMDGPPVFFSMKKILTVAVLAFSGCIQNGSGFGFFRGSVDLERIAVFAHTEITWKNSAGALRKALAYCRAEDVSRVVFLGDPTKNGYSDQRRVFREVWNEAFAGCPRIPELVVSEDPYRYEGISFTGKGKLALTDLLCVHPADGRKVNVGSMRGIDVSAMFVKLPGSAARRASESAQGVIVVRRKDSLAVKRLDFSGRNPREVGPPWVVGADGRIQSSARERPLFWKDTGISVIPGYGSDGARLLTVRWPSVLARYNGARAFSYELKISSANPKSDRVYNIQSTGFFLPEEDDVGAVSVSVPRDGLNDVVVTVTPISSLGLRGDPVEAGFSLKEDL